MKKWLLLLLLLVSAIAFPQFSKTHYIPPLSSSPDVVPEDQFLYISTPSITPINFRIISLGGGIEEGTVSRDQPYVSFIGFGENTQLNVSSDFVNLVQSGKGYIVEAEDLIAVSARVIAGNSNQAGMVVSKGLAALGTQFRIGAFLNQVAPSYGSVHYTFVSILATENNTHVSFSDIAPNVMLYNNQLAGNTPDDVILNSGESFVMAVMGPNEANRDGLIGSLVSSDKPIAVNCGSFGGTNGEMGNLDLGFDQIVSAERTGKDYIFIRGTGQDPVERILLIAHEDNTAVYLNGSAVPSITINAGENAIINGSLYGPSGNLFVHTSKNVFAYQSIGDDGRTDQANQEMFFVPPLSCQTPKVIDNIPNLNLIGDRVFDGRVTIVTETGSDLSFIIDGVPYTLLTLPAAIDAVGPSAVTGNPDYVTYIVTGLSGNVSVFSTGQLYLASYGSSQAATFGGFYSGFTFKPEVSFDRLDTDQSNCIPNITLSVSTATAFDVFQWYYNGAAIPGATLREYTPLLPGYYYVEATISDCGITLTSDQIPVSSCPNDMDNDLSNDNVDFDNDNDGLTNCFESNGNAVFNLANPLAGSINVAGYSNTFTGSYPSAVGAQAAVPFSGDASGQFVSTATAGKGNSVVYKMTYAQPVSIAMEYALTANPTDLIDSNEEFIISVPETRTITVLNPDDQLLIDTNFDGIYESGVTEFSSFEIRFRVNSTVPLAAGTGTFQFRAYLADSFMFTHKNMLDSEESRATFRISATCIPKDSDGDGAPDQIDLDSDNDGMPDTYESQGQNFSALSGADDNGDGIDNIFGNGITPADSDTDGVPDYLDLDSDNDGIFDLVESQSGATDANNNGIIDGNAGFFGVNGLANNLETSADSGVLDYSPADIDGDGLFNSVDHDSDGDACSDVREAGFADANNDGYLGSAPTPTVNANGVVTGASNGYTAPNPNYAIATPIEIVTQPQDILTCEAQDAIFSIETNTGVTYQWQVSVNDVAFTNLPENTIYSGTTTNQLTVHNTTAAMDGWKFRVVLDRGGNICGSQSETVILDIQPLPPSVTRTLVQCDMGANPDGITIFNLSEADAVLTGGNPNLSVVYFPSLTDAQNNTGALDNDYTNLSNPQALTVKMTDNTSGCFSYSTLNLAVNILANVTINLAEECEIFGEEDGLLYFDLTNANIPVAIGQTVRYYENETDALLEQNAIADPTHYQNQTPYTLQTVYARIESGNDCSRLYLINIKVNPLPDIDANLDLIPHVVCVNATTFTTTIDAAILDGSSPNDYSYVWYFNGNLIPDAHSYSLTLSVEGLYTVVVTDANGCSKTRNIPVIASSQAIIENIAVSDLSESNTVIVTLSANSYGDYLYAIDHENAMQASNVLVNVPAGIHTVYVKDKNGCPTASQVISILGIPKFFTPNGDGFNDVWNVKGISIRFHPGTRTLVFDRYGKLIKQITISDAGWDGTLNGQPLPSDDYWYVVEFDDGRIFKGHFALKR
jgi:gliding motility-associated-like protein